MGKLRFYSAETLIIGQTVRLSKNATIHATRVMRLNIGDALTLFNGDGFDYNCTLVSIKKGDAQAHIHKRFAIHNEPPLNIMLLQGISSGDRMDYTIQKAVELGVKRIQPISTERSMVKLNVERAEKRVEHWQGVVIAACEQSGRAFVPEVYQPMTLNAWLTSNPQQQACRILLNPIGAQRLSQLSKPKDEIQLLIGAEGGLSSNEIDTAIKHGFQSIILGPRILRTETAALTAMASMLTLWGDF